MISPATIVDALQRRAGDARRFLVGLAGPPAAGKSTLAEDVYKRQAQAKELGVTLKAYAGKIDGDSESQVAAIETCIADGAKGILITASDTKGIVPSVQTARDAGLPVIALDTPLEPLDAADMTFATDNLPAGELIGKWAAATLGDAAKDAKVAFLNLTPSQPSVDVLRNPVSYTQLDVYKRQSE